MYVVGAWLSYVIDLVLNMIACQLHVHRLHSFSYGGDSAELCHTKTYKPDAIVHSTV